MPNLFYSWFNHHGVAIKHLTLKDTVSFEGACLKIDNIPGVPLIPPARRGGVTFPAVGLIFSLCQVYNPSIHLMHWWYWLPNAVVPWLKHGDAVVESGLCDSEELRQHNHSHRAVIACKLQAASHPVHHNHCYHSSHWNTKPQLPKAVRTILLCTSSQEIAVLP